MPLMHEFAILQSGPTVEDEYDSTMLSWLVSVGVEDDVLESIRERQQFIPTFYGSLKRRGKGLAYYGVTLIPPDSLAVFQDVLEFSDVEKTVMELIALVKQAREKNRYIIHFGI